TVVLVGVLIALVVGWRGLAEVERETKGVCQDFLQLKNAGSPLADSLLGRQPVVPNAPVTEDEASRLQVDFFLREPIQVLAVQPADKSHPTIFRFVTRGNVAAPTIPILTARGVDRSQRTMTNPDLIVEVRDGKIYGLSAHLGD